MKKVATVSLLSATALASYVEFAGDTYEKQTRKQKSDKIWAKIVENKKSGSWHL